MPKPDLIQVRVDPTSGLVYIDTGKGFSPMSHLNVVTDVGELKSFILEDENSNLISIKKIPIADQLTISVDLLGTAGTTDSAGYALRFNDDATSDYYREGNLADAVTQVPFCWIPAGNASDSLSAYGDLLVSNRSDSIKLGYGIVNMGRGVDQMRLHFPRFSYIDTSKPITEISIIAINTSGDFIEEQIFTPGSKVNIYGKVFNK